MKQVKTIFEYFDLYREGHKFYEKTDQGQFKEVQASPMRFGLIIDMINIKELWYSEITNN